MFEKIKIVLYEDWFMFIVKNCSREEYFVVKFFKIDVVFFCVFYVLDVVFFVVYLVWKICGFDIVMRMSGDMLCKEICIKRVMFFLVLL